jgi:hypothetical protein
VRFKFGHDVGIIPQFRVPDRRSLNHSRINLIRGGNDWADDRSRGRKSNSQGSSKKEGPASYARFPAPVALIGKYHRRAGGSRSPRGNGRAVARFKSAYANLLVRASLEEEPTSIASAGWLSSGSAVISTITTSSFDTLICLSEPTSERCR